MMMELNLMGWSVFLLLFCVMTDDGTNEDCPIPNGGPIFFC